MRISEYVSFVEACLKHKRRGLAVGPPGVGKTYAAMEAARRSGFDFIGLCAPLEDPSTIRGYPARENGEATHCLFDGIAKAMRAESPTLLYFDDLGMASESTAKSMVRFMQFGEIDRRKLPDCVVIGAATNDVGQGSGVYGLIEPLKSRFHSIVSVEPHLNDTISYGLARNWPSDLLAFLRNSPEALHDWKPSKTMHPDGATPRGWEYCSEWIALGVDNPEVIAGCVGKGRASEYLAYRELISELPDVDAVLMDPENAPVPENPSARFLVTMALTSRVGADNFGGCVKYTNRLPSMFQAFFVRDACRAESERGKAGKLAKDYRPLSSSRDFTAFACSAKGKAILDAAG